MEKFIPQQLAILSTDNTRTFQQRDLNELYVENWEEASKWTKRIIDILRPLWVLTVNILEEHPRWHISFASSYKNKSPFEFITIEEIADWTDDQNWLSEKARFSVWELKAYLILRWWKERIWPDHSIEWTNWVKLTPPLEESDFDFRIVKWTKPTIDAYSWFFQTDLDNRLKQRNIKTNLITWVVTEVCVDATAKDSFELGYQTIIVEDAIIPITKEWHKQTIEALRAKWIIISTINELAKNLWL